MVQKMTFDNESESLDGNFMNIWIFNQHQPLMDFRQMIEKILIWSLI